MSIQEILKSEMNVSVTINAADLREFVRDMVTDVQQKEKERVDEVFMTVNELSAYVHKNRSTLWTWEKKGYLVPSRIGKELRYKKSEVDALMGGRK